MGDRDFLVVGYDLEQQRQVHVTDESLSYWHTRGYTGRRTLVCALCLVGSEAPVGTHVPLVVVGVTGGQRRPHFRHPPGLAPKHGYEPESVWHLSTKTILASWARRLPNVERVTVEHVIDDRTRRSDVHVHLSNGTQIAFEAQATLLGDFDWLARHEDYQRQGIHDVWVWRPRMPRVHWIVAKHGAHLWEIDPTTGTVTLLAGKPHSKHSGWWRANDEDLRLYGLHTPPCVRDRLHTFRFPLRHLELDANGFVAPPEVENQLDVDHLEQRRLADVERQRDEEQRAADEQAHNRQRQAAIRKLYAGTPAPEAHWKKRSGGESSGRNDERPSSQPAPELTCNRCGLRLDSQLADLGHHIGDCLS